MWMALSFVPIDRTANAIEIVMKKKDELYESLDVPVAVESQPVVE